jgi:glycine/sarcosine/betaine reductase complex component A
MDLEEQGTIRRVVEANERGRMVALLGTPTAGSTLMLALTLTQGDPSYAGPLAGVPLGLPVYHILEDQVKNAIPGDVYEREVGPLEFVLDRAGIVDALAEARQAGADG